jgi:hypothetical protein
MKKFAGNKTRDQVKAQCKAAGVKFDESRYLQGSDWTTLSGGGAQVLWSSWNGKFFGTTDTGIEFNSDSDEHDDKPWMQALLDFFYVSAVAA